MNSHQAEIIIITCIDYRFQDNINSWIAKNFHPGTYDRVALAGGVKNLKTILSQIDIAVKLHHITKVALINHEDCGAYGEVGTAQRHAADLKNATARIKQQYSSLAIEAFYLHLDGDFKPIS